MTTLYLIHAANEMVPRVARTSRTGSEVRRSDRRAEAARDLLAVRAIDHCFASPHPGALRTATIVAQPHGLAPVPVHALAASDIASPLDQLLGEHASASLLVVAPVDGLRAYLGAILGLPFRTAHHLPLTPCGISLLIRQGPHTIVKTLNATFHLQGLAA